MSHPPLSGRALRHLRALGHALDPVVHVGKQGVTASLVKEVSSALLRHELIKVRVQPEAPIDRKQAAELAEATGSALAQILGRTFLLYKRHPKKPKIVLPRKGGTKAEGKAASGKAAPKPAVEERSRAPEDEVDEV